MSEAPKSTIERDARAGELFGANGCGSWTGQTTSCSSASTPYALWCSSRRRSVCVGAGGWTASTPATTAFRAQRNWFTFVGN